MARDITKSAARLGSSMCTMLEVLHMCDRNAALDIVRKLIPESQRADVLPAWCAALEGLGAGALARDLRENV